MDNELLVRFKTIMVLRAIFLTGFVAIIIAFERSATRQTPILPLSAVLCTAYFLVLAYALFLRFRMRVQTLGWIQALGDLFVVTGLIFTTGGIESPLSFLFMFAIIGASVMLPRGAAYKVAGVASVLYGLLVDLEYFRVLQPVYFFPQTTVPYQGAYLFSIVTMNLASFFAVAFLSSILSDRLRLVKEELEKKSFNLRKLEAFHGKVVQYMGNGLLATDARGRIVSTNTASEKIIGMQAAEMEGRLVYEVMALPPLRDFFEQGCNASLPLKIEGDCPGGGGSVIRVGMKISRLGGPDLGAEGFICVFDDLTEIRHMEEKVRQTEQLAIVGRFSAGLAHEIRNPLASLSGSIQVLRKGLNLEGDNQQLMEIVIKETQRLNHIVTDFLNFAQPKRKKSCLIDMTQLIQDVLLLLKNSNEFHASIDMELKAPHDHILIESDEEQIRQMVWNLCINGVQAMDGEGRLTLTLARTSGFRHGEFSTSRKGILLMVEDQGRGIPQDQIQQIFNPFYTTRDEGVGLGLATVKKIVERFGGYIGVTSQDADGRPDAKTGTCFEVFLPQERALVGQRKPVREMRETHAEI